MGTTIPHTIARAQWVPTLLAGTHTGLTRVIRQIYGGEGQAGKISGVWKSLR